MYFGDVPGFKDSVRDLEAWSDAVVHMLVVAYPAECCANVDSNDEGPNRAAVWFSRVTRRL